ncbi:hypothetical protein L226DRAFT_460018 [Lentinus tigrinus ALCF2SS1-7]|uniref:Uncharacterized protein n=1 Tax=Lentinus tigrinus ALCF2SS1-6 TaxID=1328759 RepID=A0A5C2SJR7_9APHY|nr:hypothetical protein L227DRAFT_583920 [Lentinus tigrinus ALCF2SS1-6]RPD76265.1 hypothetical protein L226DRAFT_460018 [Lentinus tigrinus ALCF2SS1-7]
MVSSHNPFRTRAVTPLPTGASEAGVSSAETSSSNGDSDAPERPPQIDTSVSDILNEELPPAYTPAPNVYEGEATLELGPRRPFQQAIPMPPRQPSYGPSQFPPPSWGLSPQPTGSSGWSSFPGQRRQELYTTPAPPPIHPDLAGIQRPSSTPNSPHGPLSDFARDFYAAGAGDSGLYGGSSSRYQADESDASSPSSSSRRYAPRSGEPPNRARSPAQDSSPDDGRPTDRPVPGHPLLRHGKVLVYPAGFECQKCRNTGYRNYDPSHPCSRCWDKYAKPYAGAITCAPWTADGQASSSSSGTFQRPLPVFRAPQAALHQQSASWSGPLPANAGLSRSATTSRVSQANSNGYPGASRTHVVPIAGGVLPMSSYLDRLGGVGGRTVFPPPSWPSPGGQSGTPPSSGNAVVYAPGDPRIGGRLCWRCGGRGKTSFLIFDEETCSICGGVGRTFV